MFVPVILATFSLSQTKGWVLPSVLLMFGRIALEPCEHVLSHRALIGMKWVALAAFFALTVIGLFSCLRKARTILTAHLYTAVQYLLVARDAMDCRSQRDRRFPSGIVPLQQSHDRRPSKRTAVRIGRDELKTAA